MNKNELVDAIVEKSGLTKKDSARVLDAFIDAVSETLAKGDSVRLTGFGSSDYLALMFYMDPSAHDAIKNIILGIEAVVPAEDEETVEEVCPDYGPREWRGGSYSCELKDCIPHGQGRWIINDLNEYVGEFINDKRHGYGTLYINTAQGLYTEEGEFRNGKAYNVKCTDSSGHSWHKGEI